MHEEEWEAEARGVSSELSEELSEELSQLGGDFPCRISIFASHLQR